MLLRMTTLLPLLLVAGLAGCSDEAKEQSKYRYSLEKLNKRWVVVLKNFDSDDPRIYLATVLKKDFRDLVTSMERTYKASNRDEVLGKLKELAKKFYTDTDALVGRTAGGDAVLKPGAKVEDVGELIKKTHAAYQEIEKLVK